MFPHFPYTNFHALNLDWVIAKIRLAIMSINGNSPDEDGNVTITPTDVNAVATVNGIAPDSNGNVNVGTVKSVNSLTPNAAGNVNVGTVKSVNNTLPDSAGNVNLTTVAGVTSVGGVGPDENGNVPISVNHQSPNATGNITLRPANIDPQNVKYYGAVGDGVTDDTTAFQNALDAVKDVIVPEGTYIISSLTLPTESSLIGYGNKSTLKISGTITSTNWYTEINNINIISDKSTGTTTPVININAPYSKIENVTVTGPGYGISLGGGNSLISNSIVEMENKALIIPQSSDRVKIINCTFREMSPAQNSGTGVVVESSCSEILFNNCIITGFDVSVEIGNYSNKIDFQAVIMESANTNIKMLGTVYATTIDNCTMISNSYGIFIVQACNGIIISDSFISGQDTAIYAHSQTPAGVHNGLVSNSAIINPTVFTNGQDTYCDNWIFSGCMFAKYGDSASPTTGYVFAGSDTNCSNFMVIGNSFVGRTQIVPAAQPNKTFVNNIGYTP